MTKFYSRVSDTTGLKKSMLKYGSTYIMLSQVNQLRHLFCVANQTDSIQLMFLQIFRLEILEARTSTTQQIIRRMSIDWREMCTQALSSHFVVNSKCNEGTLDRCSWRHTNRAKIQKIAQLLVSPKRIHSCSRNTEDLITATLQHEIRCALLTTMISRGFLPLPRLKRLLRAPTHSQQHKKTSNTQSLWRSHHVPPDKLSGWGTQLIWL